MARARSLKPGFFTNGDLLECEPLARILFAGLWTEADRRGILEDRPRTLKVKLLPADECDIEDLLCQLAAHGFIVRYEADGVRCIAVINFGKHQYPHRDERANTLPALPEHHANTVQASCKHDDNTPNSLLLIPSLLTDDSLTDDSLTVFDETPAKPTPKQKRATPFPDDFEPPYEWAERELGMSVAVVDAEVLRMRDWAISKGDTKKDWIAFARNWLRRKHEQQPAATIGNSMVAKTKAESIARLIDYTIAEERKNEQRRNGEIIDADSRIVAAEPIRDPGRFRRALDRGAE
jgi:hypothetical protein